MPAEWANGGGLIVPDVAQLPIMFDDAFGVAEYSRNACAFLPGCRCGRLRGGLDYQMRQPATADTCECDPRDLEGEQADHDNLPHAVV